MFHPSVWALIVCTLGLTHITIIGVTVYLHRSQAHRAVDLHPVVAHFFRFWIWLTTAQATKAWVSVHRKHHAKCDTSDDPHSPQTKGIWSILFLGLIHYQRATRDPETLARYGQGTPDDWLENHLYTKYQALGIVLMAALDILAFGCAGIAVWVVQMMWIPFWAAGVVNGVGHYQGYRNFDCADAARNIVPWGIVIGGEELHNNHHTYPSSAKLSVKPYEFDLGWGYIRALEILGLAKVKKTPPRLKWSPIEAEVSPETVRTLAQLRFEVLAYYSTALQRIHRRQAQRSAFSVGRSFWKRLAITRFSGKDHNALRYLQTHGVLVAQALRLRDELIEVWSSKQASQVESVERLVAWCQKVESSNIPELQLVRRHIQRMRPLAE